MCLHRLLSRILDRLASLAAFRAGLVPTPTDLRTIITHRR
ncbi:MAG: hypothetical protein OHK0015_32710 [Chloroflexi bacterium OHK40]